MLSTTSMAAEKWVSSKVGAGGEDGYNVKYTVAEIEGRTQHNLTCTGSNDQECVWPAAAGYSGPPPIVHTFVPHDNVFYHNGVPMALTGEQLNNLIYQNYLNGIYSGVIVVGGVTFTFQVAVDLSSSTVDQLD